MAAAAFAGGICSSGSVEQGLKVEVASAADAEEGADVGSNGEARPDQMYASGCIGGVGERLVVLTKKRGRVEMAAGCVTTAKERISRMPPCAAGKRSSIYRGVTRSKSVSLPASETTSLNLDFWVHTSAHPSLSASSLPQSPAEIDYWRWNVGTERFSLDKGLVYVEIRVHLTWRISRDINSFG